MRNGAPSKRTLLILTCGRDAVLARNLLSRIGELGGWQHFSHLHLHLDRDVSRVQHADVSAAIPMQIVETTVSRSEGRDDWQQRRAETMLGIYQKVCRLHSDIVRIDPDVFIRGPEFFETVLQAGSGISGKLMKLHLPAVVAGRQLDFIQGGVSCWGGAARDYLQSLGELEVTEFKACYSSCVELGDPSRRAEYDHFLCTTEDVVLSGALAIAHGVDRLPLSNLQVSSYDVLRDHRSDIWTYDDHVLAFESSAALAFHFEGSHSNRRDRMTRMLLRYYEDRGSGQTTSA